MTLILNPFVAQRKVHKDQLYSLIKDHPDADPNQLVALFSLKTGLKRSTIIEYWRELQEAGLIENGFSPVDPSRVERGRENLKYLDERRVRTSTDNQRHGEGAAGSQQQKEVTDLGRENNDNSGKNSTNEH